MMIWRMPVKTKKLSKTDQLLELLGEWGDPPLLFPTGHEDAIVGIVERFGTGPLIVLDKHKIIRKLMRDKMTEEEAEEFFQFNIIGAWMGEGTPAFITFTKDLV